MNEENIGNNITEGNGSSSFQKDIDALVKKSEESTIGSKISGAVDTLKGLGGLIKDKYEIFTNDDIKSGGAFSDLKSTIEERSNEQFKIASNQSLSKEEKEIGYSNINKKYQGLETDLLTKAIKGNNIAEQYEKFYAASDKLTKPINKEDDVTKVYQGIYKEIETNLNRLDKGTASGLVDNDTLNFKLGLKQSLAEETSKFYTRQRELIAELTTSNADQNTINAAKKDFDRAIALRELINKHSLDAANQGIINGDELTDYVTKALGPALTKEAVDIENNIFREANKLNYKANLKNAEYFVGGLQMIGSGTSYLIGQAKEIVNTTSTYENRFKRDFNELKLQDKSGLEYMLSWTIDNLDDIILEVGGAGISGGGAVAVTKYGTSKIAKATKLSNMLDNTVLGQSIKNSKVLKATDYLAKEGVMGLVGNQSLNIAAGDINSEERIVLDAMMDFTMSPIFDGAINRTFWAGRQIQKGVEASALGKLMTTEKSITDELVLSGINPDDANTMVGSLKNYLSITNKDNSNKSIIDFIKVNKEKLLEEGTVLGEGKVFTIREFQAKAENPFNVDVTEAKALLDSKININLNDNTLTAIDLNQTFKKINIIDVKKTPSQTVETLLKVSGTINKNDINRFISDPKNEQLIKGIHDSLYNAKNKISIAKISGVVNEANNPLNDIAELNNVYNILTDKLSTTQQVVSVFMPEIDQSGNAVFVNRLIKSSDLNIDGYTVMTNYKGQDRQVFLNNTILDKVNHKVYDTSDFTSAIIRNGSIDIPSKENVQNIIDDLTVLFGTNNIKTDGTGIINLNIIDNKISLSLGTKTGSHGNLSGLISNKNAKLQYRGKDINVTLNEETVLYGNINKILLRKVLARTDKYNPGEFEDILESHIINLAHDISVGKITGDYISKDIDTVAVLARQNTNKLFKGIFSDNELRQFNNILDDTIFTKSALHKLATASGLGNKETSTALGTLIEGLTFKAGERFKQLESKKVLFDIQNSKLLSAGNKREAILNLLLGQDPVNAFKYIGDNKSWNITKGMQDILRTKPTDPIFTVSKEKMDRFKESVLSIKKELGLSTDNDLEVFKRNMDAITEGYIDKALAIYTDRVIRTALNNDRIDNILFDSIKVSTGTKDIDTTGIKQLQQLLLDQPNITNLVIEANQIIETIPKELPQVEIDRLFNIVDVINKRIDESKGSTPVELISIVEGVDKVTDVISKNFDFEKSFGNTYSYDSQVSGGDNIFKKSLNYILNPYQQAQIFDSKLAAKIDDLLMENILKPNGYKGKSYFELSKIAKETDGDAFTYDKEVEKANAIMRKFIYGENLKSFNAKEAVAATAKRDTVIDSILETIRKEIENYDGLAILNKKGKLASKKEKGEIVMGTIDRWALINTIQTRLTKRHFDGFKIDFKTNESSPIKGIEEYRTMFTHFYNAGGSKGNYKPLILEGNTLNQFSYYGGREGYRVANNFLQFLKVNEKKGAFTINEQGFPKISAKYLKYLQDHLDLIGNGGSFKSIEGLVKRLLRTNDNVPGFINLMNVGDKDSFGAYTVSYKKDANTFSEFMDINDDQFTKDMYSELNLKDATGKPLSLAKAAKRLATITAEEESLLPGSKIPLRNYIIDEPEYLDIMINDKDKNPKSYGRTDIFIIDKSGKPTDFTDIGKEWLIENFQKELSAYKKNFTIEDFNTFGEGILDFIQTPYSDGVSFLHPEQIKFYSRFQSHIGKTKGEDGQYYSVRSPIKMHHYAQNKDISILFKTNFNSYTDEMLEQMKGIVGDTFDFNSTRIIGYKSVKLENYGSKFIKMTEDKFININGVPHKIKGYMDTDSSMDKHASSESEVHEEVNGITKQADTRTHPVASEFILRVKQDLITESINTLKNTFNIDAKMDATIFNEYEQFSRYVLNNLGIKGDTLASVNQYLNDKLKGLKELIEKPKQEGLGFRTIMQPRIYSQSIDGSLKFIEDDELHVSADRFNSMKEKMLLVDGEYYVMTYRNPVPNAENMTLKKVKIDYSMVSMEDAAISPWDAFVNKQADYDGDHLNITYINNPLDKSNQLGGLGITLGYILNLEEVNGNSIIGQSIANKVYTTNSGLEVKDDVFEFIITWIKNNSKNGLPQTRVPVEQVNKDLQTDIKKIWLHEKVDNKRNTITTASSNAITGKDNISVVDSFIRTIDLIRKYGWEYNNAEYIGKTTEDILSDLKDTLEFPIRKLIDNKSKLLKIGEDVTELDKKISSLSITLNQVLDSISGTISNPLYKSKAAGLEQMTLDLASVGADSMPEGWEVGLLQSVFPNDIDTDNIKILLDPIGASTGKTYDLLGESKTMEYGISYDDKIRDYSKIDLPLLGQHKSLFNRLYNEIKSIRENLSTISNVKADKKFFGYNEGISYRDKFDQVMAPYNTNHGLQFLKDNPGKSYKGFIKNTWDQEIPGIQTVKGIHKVVDRELFDSYMKDKIFTEITTSLIRKPLPTDKVYQLLKSGKAFFDKNPYVPYLTYNKNTRLATLVHEYKEQFVNEVTDVLGIKGVDKQSVMLNSHLGIDRSELTPAQRIKLTFWHFIMKHPDLKNNKLSPHEELSLLESGLSSLVKDVKESDAIDESTKATLKDISKELDLDISNIQINKGTYTVYSDKELSLTVPVGDQIYFVNRSGKGEYILTPDSYKQEVKIDNEVSAKVLKDLQSSPIKREFDLEKNLGIDLLKFQKATEEADKFINDMGNYQTLLMGAKAIKPFKNLLLRNQELKNNASFDLYEGFADLQREFSGLNKVRLREIDNVLFMKIYKGNDDPSVRVYDDFIRSFSDTEKTYYSKMSEFVLGQNKGKQSINDLFGKLNINLDALLADGKPIYTKIRSSLIEDLVNLRHKTEKIAFYEAGIYNKKTFLAHYKKNVDEQGLPYSEKEATQLFEVIFEYDILSKGIMGKTLSLMRNTSYASTLGVMSWLSGMAGLTMGLMQIPSELTRLGSLSKHSFKPEDLNSLMNQHSILKSTGIEAGVYFGPVEVKPPIVQQYMYKALSKLQGAVGMSDGEMTETIKRYASAFANNPLLITDIVVDKGRKQVALGNVISMLGFKSPESFSAHISTLSKTDATELLNKVRLASELKYHELSGGVTAGSYLWRETTFARKGIMQPFSYLMNWSHHVMSSAIGDARQTYTGFENIFKGNIEEGLRLIRNSNLFEKTATQSLVAAGLYAKLHSYDTYEGEEFDTKKDMWEFVKTLNANIVATEMFWPVKAISKGLEQEGGPIAKLAAGFTSVTSSMYREADLMGIMGEELWSAYKVPGYGVREAITTAIAAKGSAGLAFNKMIQIESSYPEFTRRAIIDQMFGSNNPNFDEELYSKIYGIAKGNRLDALYESGNYHLILGEIGKAIPIIRHLSNLIDGGTSYSLFDKQVREINKQISDKSFDIYYNNPELMLLNGASTGTNKKIWNYMTGYATSYGTIDYRDKDKVATELSSLIPTMPLGLYQQLTENIMVGEVVSSEGVQGYIDAIKKGSTESQQYQLQLAEKLKTESPAKLPYVLSIILNSEYYDINKAYEKSGRFLNSEEQSQIQDALMLKYSGLIKDNVPLMSQLIAYQVATEKPELKDLLISKEGFVNSHIADRIATKVMITEAYNKGDNSAYIIGTRFGTITNKLRTQFKDGNIDEGVYKTALLDLYREADDAIYNSKFTSNERLEIKTTLYKSLGADAHILHEDSKLGLAYEGARINLANKLYKHSSELEKYMIDAELKHGTWKGLAGVEGFDGYTGFGKSDYSKAYRNTYTVKPNSGGSYSPGYVKNAANNIQRMLGDPRTNFSKAFNPRSNPYSQAITLPFGFRFTVDDSKRAIDYFRVILSDQYSKTLIPTDVQGIKAYRTRFDKRRSERIQTEQKDIGSQVYRRPMSRGLMRGLPGGED